MATVVIHATDERELRSTEETISKTAYSFWEERPVRTRFDTTKVKLFPCHSRITPGISRILLGGIALSSYLDSSAAFLSGL